MSTEGNCTICNKIMVVYKDRKRSLWLSRRHKDKEGNICIGSGLEAININDKVFVKKTKHVHRARNTAVYKIESNIPIPDDIRTYVYPFNTMNIGDSFLIPYKSGRSRAKQVKDIRSSISHYRKKHVSSRFIAACIENGVRVWRTE